MIRAVQDRIIVRPLEEDYRTPSGFIAQKQSEKPVKGEVVSVGPGLYLENGQRSIPDVKVGDIIFFTRYSTDEIDVQGTTYLSIKESMILGYLPREENDIITQEKDD